MMKKIALLIAPLLMLSCSLSQEEDTNPEKLTAETAYAESLIFMREEEKLARDVYLSLYAEWGQPIFQNISSSEQQHMDAVLVLLNNYGIEDPVTSLAVGEFTNEMLAALYDDLMAHGTASVTKA